MSNQIYKKDRLKNYWIWYYLRYYPSINRLREKLLSKSDNNYELSNEVISEMKNIITEKELLKSKIRMFLDRNKNVSYIKRNLQQKKFEMDMINEVLYTDFLVEEKSFLKDNFVYRKILEYKSKWKSIFYIKSHLIERQLDKEIVEKYIEEIFIDWEYDQIRQEYEKIKDRYPKEKCIQKLITKWFNYSQIKEIVEA